MSLLRRFWRCLMENGPRYTVIHMWNRLTLWLRKKIVMPNYYDDLRNRINNYQKRYPVTPRRTAVRLIWWNFKSLFKRHSVTCSEIKNQNKPVAQKEKAESYLLNLSQDVLNIGILINGGLGDFLIAANFIFKFRQKFGYDHIRLDVFAHNSFSTAKSIFFTGDVIDHLYPEEGYSSRFRDYDLFFGLNRYPDIKRRQLNRIAEIAPELLEWIYLAERFRAEHSRFFEKRIITDGQSVMLSILEGKKRNQQPDIYGFFGIGEKNEYPLKIYVDETECLKSFGLWDAKYITLHRGCDVRQASESVKMWPLQYYNILTKLLKRKFPDIMLVQIGISHDRCQDMLNTDLNLVEQTNLEQVKVLLKHSILHVDGEGGMVHLRHALAGTPSVVFFGPTASEFYGYSENINIVGNGCSTWCEWAVQGWMEKCLRDFDIPPCMSSIIPENVFETISGFLMDRGMKQ